MPVFTLLCLKNIGCFEFPEDGAVDLNKVFHTHKKRFCLNVQPEMRHHLKINLLRRFFRAKLKNTAHGPASLRLW